jgi:hypothetical protein
MPIVGVRVCRRGFVSLLGWKRGVGGERGTGGN